jgi:predicted DCC family thiol-disulfide oxidoreductase YuxK
MTEYAGPLLLYDGSCGFCASSVRFVLRHDRRGTLRFAALQSAFGQRVVARYPQLRNTDSVVWLDESDEPAVAPEHSVSVRSDAALRVLEYLGGWWTIARIIIRLVPRPLRDAAYDLIARHRHRLSRANCLVPTAAERRRFIDD